MSYHTEISWADATWNVLVGCTKVSPGCDHCYAIRTAHRMSANPNPKIATAYAGTEADGEWTGRVNLLEQRLDQPLRWAKPRRIFVNAQSDLFHDNVPDKFIARVFAVMSQCPQHTFQVLTKRHGRMRSLLSSEAWPHMVAREAFKFDRRIGERPFQLPLPNVWLGVSVENQQWADIRGAALRETPATVRFFSAEPLLGPIVTDLTGIDWVIAGGESGPGARPMHPDWARSLRDQCTAAGVPFHFKQQGEYVKVEHRNARPGDVWVLGEDGMTVPWRLDTEGAAAHRWGPHRDELMRRVGKKAAGRELDGRVWDEFPEGVTAR